MDISGCNSILLAVSISSALVTVVGMFVFLCLSLLGVIQAVEHESLLIRTVMCMLVW